MGIRVAMIGKNTSENSRTFKTKFFDAIVSRESNPRRRTGGRPGTNTFKSQKGGSIH